MNDEFHTFPQNAGNCRRYFVGEEIKKRLEAEAELAKLEVKPINNDYRRPKLCPHCHKQIG